MIPFKFIHAADIHLDSPLQGLEQYEGAPVDEIRGATRRALENLVALAIEAKVDFVLIAGDVYDGDWQDYNTGLFFAAQMAALKAASSKVFIIRGNHDATSRITKSLTLPENVFEFSHLKPQTKELKDLGVAIHGQSFATQAVSDDLSAEYPAPIPGYYNIGLLHTSADGRPDHASYAPCSVQSLKTKGYDYWALGHIHMREILSEAEPWIVFPGNIQGRHIRETGEKGCTLVNVDEAGRATLEHRSLDVLRWQLIYLDATGIDTAEAAFAAVEGKLIECAEPGVDRLMAIRVIISGETAAHTYLSGYRNQALNDLRARVIAIGAGRFWLEKLVVSTRELQVKSETSSSDIGKELLEYVDLLAHDDAQIAELIDSMSKLRNDLPHEIRTGSGDVEMFSPEHILGSLETIRQILISRLQS